MRWFKHYNNAYTSAKLLRLVDKIGMKGYGQYWAFLELLCEKYDYENDCIEVHKKEIGPRVHIKFDKTLHSFIELLSNFDLITYEESGNFYKFKAPILTELQSRDFKKARYDKNENADDARDKKEEERKKKEERESQGQRSTPPDPIPVFAKGNNTNPIVNPDQLIDYWQQIMVPAGFKPVTYWPGGQIKQFMAHSQVVGGHEQWKKLLINCAGSDFLRGAKGFGVSWFFDEPKFTKLVNGEYFDDAESGDAASCDIGSLLGKTRS